MPSPSSYPLGRGYKRHKLHVGEGNATMSLGNAKCKVQWENKKKKKKKVGEGERREGLGMQHVTKKKYRRGHVGR